MLSSRHLDLHCNSMAIDDEQAESRPASEMRKPTGTAVSTNEDWRHYLMNSRQGSPKGVAARSDFLED